MTHFWIIVIWNKNKERIINRFYNRLYSEKINLIKTRHRDCGVGWNFIFYGRIFCACGSTFFYSFYVSTCGSFSSLSCPVFCSLLLLLKDLFAVPVLHVWVLWTGHKKPKTPQLIFLLLLSAFFKHSFLYYVRQVVYQ